MYELVDVAARSLVYPTFKIPTMIARESLLCGDLAQLIISGRERLWVKVERVFGTGLGKSYVGVVQSSPVEPEVLGVRTGDEVSFSPRHVADIELRSESYDHAYPVDTLTTNL